MMTSHSDNNKRPPGPHLDCTPKGQVSCWGPESPQEKRGVTNLKNLNDKGNKYGYLLINYHDLFCKYSEW